MDYQYGIQLFCQFDSLKIKSALPVEILPAFWRSLRYYKVIHPLHFWEHIQFSRRVGHSNQIHDKDKDSVDCKDDGLDNLLDNIQHDIFRHNIHKGHKDIHACIRRDLLQHFFLCKG